MTDDEEKNLKLSLYVVKCFNQDKKEKDFSLRSNPLKKHKRPHFLMWSFILQLKHPLVQQTKIG